MSEAYQGTSKKNSEEEGETEAMHTGVVLPRYIRRADTFKRVAETRPRPANVVGKGRFSLTDFLPGV
jgi:hypothetical protein